MIEKRQRSDYPAADMASILSIAADRNAAIVDRDGEILAVNECWKKFAEANEFGDSDFGVGENYFDVCRLATLDPNARAALDGIGKVLSGAKNTFRHKYPCHSPWEQRWFELFASPVAGRPDLVILTHERIENRNTELQPPNSRPGNTDRRKDRGSDRHKELKLALGILLLFIAVLIWLAF